jgi:hypothetical protein
MSSTEVRMEKDSMGGSDGPFKQALGGPDTTLA